MARLKELAGIDKGIIAILRCIEKEPEPYAAACVRISRETGSSLDKTLSTFDRLQSWGFTQLVRDNDVLCIQIRDSPGVLPLD
ncbi:MAG: hypothetical protein ABR507_06210 [Actinomycetota bacterium]|nr:hypothetical protein [Actinomycetota bacterium]